MANRLTIRRCAGHTLVEILLALGLSLVILVAVYAALDQHWRYAEAGQRQTERMQVTRALFEQLQADLRAVVFRPVALDPEGVAASGLLTRSAGTVSPLGIRGDAQSLTIQIGPPPADPALGSQRVHWEMAAFEADLEGPSDFATEVADGTASTRTPSTSLARQVQSISSPVTNEELAAMQPNHLVAAEVTAIRFRYFSEGSWFTSWDSAARQQLPAAVEILIDFRQPLSGQPQLPTATSTGEYRLVVPVPVSEA